MTALAADTDLKGQEPEAPLRADLLLRQRAETRPQALALADPPNRESFGLAPPRSFTYAEANEAVDILAQFFIEIGLQPDDTVVVQLPNMTEQPLVILAAWRAGLTVAMVPMLWRGLEIASVCDQVAPKALIGVSSFGAEMQGETLCAIAASQLSVRFVLGFGPELPDGVSSLDEVMDVARSEPASPVPTPARKGPALLTFTARPDAPLVSVPRSEETLLAQGTMTALALGLTTRDVILSAYPFTGPAGLALALMPWLVSGCAISQHQPFDYGDFVQQLLVTEATVTALPSTILGALALDDVLRQPDCKIRRLGRVWSLPELTEPLSDLDEIAPPDFDLYPLGDLAAMLRLREPNTDPGLLPRGSINVDANGESAAFVETLLRKQDGDAAGTLLLRGPVVPHNAGKGWFAREADGFVASGQCAEAGGRGGNFIRLKREPELLHHGGLTLAACELDNLYESYPGFLDAACFVLHDKIVGDRIFAAIVPKPSASISLEGVHRFLKDRGVAPYKFPDRLLVVKEIARDRNGRVLREQILSRV